MASAYNTNTARIIGIDYQDRPQVGHGIYHPSARPMEVIKDDQGVFWLCDKGVDTHHNLSEQGCWRCGDLAFTRDD
jgi:hypothetical protein